MTAKREYLVIDLSGEKEDKRIRATGPDVAVLTAWAEEVPGGSEVMRATSLRHPPLTWGRKSVACGNWGVVLEEGDLVDADEHWDQVRRRNLASA
ncbi:hypothetical protein [Ectothiorhodospira shaposhnikovii]|uniref:hypothetical protein n=1 Tax=Ectothiorhodospira shaposhnikovii TaxID=1054 RepID=UPI001EE8E054|nr:hypothetical protein [Ectothiorhodospira shaposhnikovii]MCG5512817.1 hypothetical protein [Ectothiorhodospira shaposhnikovii]